MSFVKTFQEFKTQASSISEKAISGGSVTKETAKAGELARYTVVLKATADNDTISDANPAQSALDMLVSNQEFKGWYAGTSSLKDAAEREFDIMNSQSIAFVETGKHRQAGFLKREKATETFVFKPIGRRAFNTEGESDLNYDLSKFPTQAKSTISSGGTVYAWNSEQEAEMKLATKKRVKIPFAQLTVDSAMNAKASTPEPEKSSATGTSGSAGTAGTSGSAGTAGTSGTASGSATTAKYAGLKLTQTFDQKIKDLQSLIIAKGGDAAASINAKGGAVGKYGAGTAKAIGILIGSNKEENEITADIDAKLQAALAGVTVSTTTKAPAAASTKTASAPAASGGSGAKTVTTKKGTLTF